VSVVSRTGHTNICGNWLKQANISVWRQEQSLSLRLRDPLTCDGKPVRTTFLQFYLCHTRAPYGAIRWFSESIPCRVNRIPRSFLTKS